MKRFSSMVLLLWCIAGLAGCGHADEARERNVLLELLAGEHYSELDKVLAEDQARYLNGKLSSNDWAGRFLTLAALDARFDVKFNQWVRASTSEFARLARGMHFQHEAWIARGNAPAADTTDAEFAAMRALAIQARPDLLAAYEKIPHCALCAGELINNNRALEERATDRELLEAALRSDPKMYWPVLAYYQGIHPNWDSYEEIEAFINDMHQRLGDAGLAENMESRMYRDRARQVLQFKFIDSIDRAIALYEKGVNPHSSRQLLRELADIYIRRGNFVRTADLLETDLKINTPPSVHSMDKLAEAYVALGQSRKAKELAAKLAEEKQRYPYLYMD
ncbi:MAG TPA: DUF4034 domain-containing protein [Noviherbaspirillum sp.]